MSAAVDSVQAIEARTIQIQHTRRPIDGAELGGIELSYSIVELFFVLIGLQGRDQWLHIIADCAPKVDQLIVEITQLCPLLNASNVQQEEEHSPAPDKGFEIILKVRREHRVIRAQQSLLSSGPFQEGFGPLLSWNTTKPIDRGFGHAVMKKMRICAVVRCCHIW